MDIKDFWNLQNIEHCRAVINFTYETWLEHMVKWYEEMILTAKKSYYVSEEPIMDDQAYDKCEELLRLIKPDSLALSKVGYEMEKEND